MTEEDHGNVEFPAAEVGIAANFATVGIGHMTLVQDFAYVDPSGLRWDAPAGAVVDGASIPRMAWSVIGGPEGLCRKASVIHDVACDRRRQPWEKVHEAFYTAMLAAGVPAVTAKVMYAAVYHFCPRWPLRLGGLLGGRAAGKPPHPLPPSPTAIEPPPTPVAAQFEAMKMWIETSESDGVEISLAEIRGLKG
jgi:hypothetical protein